MKKRLKSLALLALMTLYAGAAAAGGTGMPWEECEISALRSQVVDAEIRGSLDHALIRCDHAAECNAGRLQARFAQIPVGQFDGWLRLLN